MKKTDIGKKNTYKQGGQENLTNIVQTPIGEVKVPAFVRVPKLKASKRTWKIWFERFIEFPKKMDNFWKEWNIQRRLKERKK